MTNAVIPLMSDAYPELIDAKSRIESVIEREEQRFFKILEVGSKQFTDTLDATLERVLPGIMTAPTKFDDELARSPDTAALLKRSGVISGLRKRGPPCHLSWRQGVSPL